MGVAVGGVVGVLVRGTGVDVSVGRMGEGVKLGGIDVFVDVGGRSVDVSVISGEVKPPHAENDAVMIMITIR
jgi:hypothetical protein